MPASRSSDLRRWLQLWIEEGLSGWEAARRLRISATTGGRRVARKVWRGESLVPAKGERPHGSGELDAFRDFLVDPGDPGSRHHAVRVA